MTLFTFRMPIETESLNKWSHNSFALKRVKALHHAAVKLAMPWQLKALAKSGQWSKAAVTLHRVGPRRFGEDSLIASMKWVRDAIAMQLVGGTKGQRDDDDALGWHYEQSVGPDYWVVVEVRMLGVASEAHQPG